MQKYSEILDELKSLTVDHQYKEQIKLAIAFYNPFEIRKLGLECTDKGELIVSDALNQISKFENLNIDDLSYVFGLLSKQILWLREKPKRQMTLFIHEFIDKQLDGVANTCVKGCSACCHQKVNFLQDEVELIKEHGFMFSSQKGVCPLLKDNLCSVYDIRPIACRNHLSVCDPKLCTTDPEKVQYTYDLEASILISAYLSVYELVEINT